MSYEYQAEDLIIGQELEKFRTTAALLAWAKSFDLEKHHLVLRKKEELVSWEVMKFDCAQELRRWASEHGIDRHPSVLTRLEYIVSLDEGQDGLFEAEEDVMAVEMGEMKYVQDVRKWGNLMMVTDHPSLKRKIEEIYEDCLDEDLAEMVNMEEETIEKEMEGLDSTQQVRQWGDSMSLGHHHTIKKKILDIREQRATEYRCVTCNTLCKTDQALKKHVKSVHEQKRFSCRKCDKTYSTSSNRNRHEKTCSGSTLILREYQCGICKTTYDSVEKLKEHQATHSPQQKGYGPPTASASSSSEVSHNNPGVTETAVPSSSTDVDRAVPGTSTQGGMTEKTFNCRLCKEMFSSRKAFYLHRMLRHQVGDGGLLQEVPWGANNAPWQDEEGNTTDEVLQTVYEANAGHILSSHKPGDVRETFNVPLNNNVTTEQILDEVKTLFQSQRYTFRINFMFGMILRHVETGELRYFIPDQNETLLHQPIQINSMRDITLKLRRKLDNTDIMEYLLHCRSDSKWRPVFLTNMKTIIYKSNFLLGNGGVTLPEYVLKNKNIRALLKCNGQTYRDNLCAFRCLASHYSDSDKALETSTKQFFSQWVEYLMTSDICDLTSVLPANYPGMNFSDLHLFETCFKINANIYTLQEDGSANLFYRSAGRFKDTIYMNVFENHLSHITNINAFSKRYQCRICELMFPRATTCSRHEEICQKKTAHKHPGGFYNVKQSIFEELEEYDIVVPKEERFYPWHIVFDFEALLQPISSHANGTEKLKWCAEHVPISVSVCSNIPGFEDPECIVNEDVDQLVEEMVGKMEIMATAASEIARAKWSDVFQQLTADINKWSNNDKASHKLMVSALQILKGKMSLHCSQVPVLGFNSAKYDLNLIKKFIAKHLRMDDTDDAGITVKKNNMYTCISNRNLKFLDITQYLAAGTSYSKFLKAFDIQEAKGFFPYEYMTDAEKLKETSLPCHCAFYSELRDCNITRDEYTYCKNIWKKKKMTCMKDFLIWYNNMDVGPFVKAVEKMQEFYFAREIDVFKIAMSVPGIARNMLFRIAKQAGASFSVLGKEDKDLHQTIKSNIIGGPSIIFKRHAKTDATYIRNNEEKPCKRIVGYDANALYLWALDQALPTGSFIRRSREKGFVPQKREKYVAQYHWLDWTSLQSGKEILHKMNYGREKRVGPYPVDGFCPETNTIFQFQGCYYHGHECYLTKHTKDKEKQLEKKKKTKETSDFLRSQGYKLVEMKECVFNTHKRNSAPLREFINERTPQFYQKHKGEVTEKQLLDGVIDDSLFGMLEVDLQVPELWPAGFEREESPYQYFEEMAPLFCTTDIPFSGIGEHMQQHLKDNDLSTNPRRLLVGGMKGRKMLLATPLLKWYLQHGMVVTAIHQVIEYTPRRCFRKFVKEVTEARRLGDVKEGMAVIADLMKLIGNSAYGGLIMDKTKHKIIKYVRGGYEASRQVNNMQFRHLTELDTDMYEVEMAKPSITHDLPIQLGYFILQYAKLRMLEFYYDFMIRYVSKDSFEYLEMDTDSAYMAIAGDTLDQVIKPEMRYEYNHALYGYCTDQDIDADTHHHWFPRQCCKKHNIKDKRTPGLFKLEFAGDEMISLCSKTYIVRGGDEIKFSCKGLQKHNIQNTFDTFSSVLKTGQTKSSTNRGFRAKDNGISTYQQQRAGFTYFYCKREVLANGIDTKVLDIVLCPDGEDLNKKQETVNAKGCVMEKQQC